MIVEELKQRLLRDGILYASSTQPIVRADGSAAAWMLDTLPVSLSSDGARLAARCLLEELKHFEGKQLATFGTTGVPLLEAVVLAGGGRYHGLLVRKEVKTRGSLKRIEGRIDRGQPVVIVDDSVSGGAAMHECAEHLRDAGLEVEGGVCLVRFGYGGVSHLKKQGLKVRASLDVYDDLMPSIPGEEGPASNPTRAEPLPPLSRRRAPEGLHPALLARAALEEFRATGRLLRSPRRMSQPVDARGGVFVSLRLKRDLDVRPARGGFWVFPGEAQLPSAEAVVHAAVQAGRLLPSQVSLDACAVAVTAFGPLKECAVGALDNQRYGIVVRSAERTGVMGGALPRMPGIREEWTQFAHAAFRNAGLEPDEGYRLFRHPLQKFVEPGEGWQPTGAPQTSVEPRDQVAKVAPLVKAARAAVLNALGFAGAAPACRVPDGVDALYVTAFANGALLGCAGGPVDASILERAASAVVVDRRFRRVRPKSPSEVAVTVSLLKHELEVGTYGPDEVMGPTRFGQQAMAVGKGKRSALLLPQTVMMNDWSPEEFGHAALEKAGLPPRPAHWTRYDCTSWLDDGRGLRKLVDGAAEPRLDSSERLEVRARRLFALWRGFLERSHFARGTPATRYLPFADELRTSLEPGWLAHAGWVRARTGLAAQAKADLKKLGASREVSPAAFTLLARLELGLPVGAQVGVLRAAFSETGHCRAETDAELDYLPGQALLALAAAGPKSIDRPLLEAALGVCRRRFRARPDWGAVSWLAQAFSAWGRQLRDRRHLRFALEVADWALPSQSHLHGGFLNDLVPGGGPGAPTAVVLEGVAAALAAAETLKDSAAARYRRSLHAGLGFLDRLTWQPRDAAILPNAGFAFGGVRTSLLRSDVRLDFVQHSLCVACALLPRRRK